MALPIIALLIILAYANAYHPPFVLDDLDHIRDSKLIEQIGPISKYVDAHRPVVLFTLSVNYALGQRMTGGYHIFNTLVHIINAFLLFGIIVLALGMPTFRYRFNETHRRWLALIMTLAWALHPLATQSVTYIIQRGESIASFGILAATYCLLLVTILQRRHDSGEVSRYRMKLFFLGLGGLLAGLIGIGAKPVAAAVPLVVLVTDFVLVSRTPMEFCKRRWWYHLLMILCWPALFAIMWHGNMLSASGASAGFGHDHITPLNYFRTQLEVIPHYLTLVVRPVHLCFDYVWPQAQSWQQVMLPGAMLVLLALIGIVGLFLRRWWSAPILSFFFILGPSSSFIPINDFAAEHRMYLPLACMVIVIIAIALRVLQFVKKEIMQAMPRRLAATGLLLAVVLAGMTFARNSVYHTRERLYNNVIAHPIGKNNWRARNNLAMFYYRTGNYPRALELLESAVKLKPDFQIARLNLGELYYLGNHFDDMIRSLEPVADDSHAYAPNRLAWIRCYLGLAYLGKGQPELAEKRFRHALEADQKLDRAHLELARLEESRGNDSQAITHYEAVMEQVPTHLQAGAALAHLYLAQGKFEQAEALRHKMLEAHQPIEHDLKHIGQQLAGLSVALANASTSDDQTRLNALALIQSNEATRDQQALVQLLSDEATQQYQAGDIDSAYATFTRALSYDPADANLLVQTAQAAGKLKRDDDVIVLYTQAAYLDPADGVFLEALAQYLFDQSRYQQSLDIGQQAAPHRPPMLQPVTVARNAMILAAAPDPTLCRPLDALTMLEPFLNTTWPKSLHPVLAAQAAAYASLGQYDLSIQYIQQAMDTAKANNDQSAAEVYAKQLALYEQQLPYQLPRAENEEADNSELH